jgi:hypothetical protein
MKSTIAVALLVCGFMSAPWGQNRKIPSVAKNPTFQNLYPNELPGFKFYARHLAPLQPFVSEEAQVIKLLGDSSHVETERWRLQAYFVGAGNKVNGHPWAHDITGRLAAISITPKERVSMLGVKFPSSFTQSAGGVSEINVSCDVYADTYGLGYWLYAEDSAAGRKGDLMKIEYGPSERVERSIRGMP